MNLGGLLGGFAEGASDGFRTALDFVDRRERRAYQQEDMANKREDRRLAMEDRGRRLQDEERARRVAGMQETLTTDEFNEQQRKTRMRDTVRSELKSRFEKQNAARDAWLQGDGADQPPGFLTRTEAPEPKGTLAMYDDMIDNPPEEWRNDPEYVTAMTALRTAAEKEGLGAMYSAWKRNATPVELGKIFNRHGDHYASQFKSGKDFSDEDIKAMGQDPADKKNILVAIDKDGRHLPMHMPSVGKFLGLEKETKWVKGPDNSGIVYDETDPRRHFMFPDQPKQLSAEDQAKASESAARQRNDLVARAAGVLKNGYFAGGEIQFDTDRGRKYTQANGLAQTWLARGMSNPDGSPLQPERVAELAKGVADGEYTVEDVNQAFRFTGTYALGGPALEAPKQKAATWPTPTGGVPQGAFVVAQDAQPSAPPAGAPPDGSWRKTEQGWIYVDRDRKNAWMSDAAPPATAAQPAPAAAPAPAPTPKPATQGATQQPPADPVGQARALDTQIAQLKATLSGSAALGPDARRSAQTKLSEMEKARAALGVSSTDMEKSDRARLEQEFAAAQTRLAELEKMRPSSSNHRALTELQDLRAKVAAMKQSLGAQPAPTALEAKPQSQTRSLRPATGNGASGSWGQPVAPGPTALEKPVAPAMEAPRNEYERAAAGKSLKIPPPPGPKQPYTVTSSNGVEVYRFPKDRRGPGEVGYFKPDPNGKGVLFQRINGEGKPEGTPIGADSKEGFLARRAKQGGK